jgi:acylphosphatase
MSAPRLTPGVRAWSLVGSIQMTLKSPCEFPLAPVHLCFYALRVYALSVFRATIKFTGRVQGVGFRYTTVNIARRFAITGWVRNELDGSVQCVAEGQQQELDRFIEAVKHAMAGHIENVDVQSSPATGEFTGFDVRR